MYRILADLVVATHLAYILFAMFGGFLLLLWRRAHWLHLPSVLWGVWIEVRGGVCPLTPLENALRRRAGGEGYGGGFIEHYIVPVIYPSGLTPTIQASLGVGLAVLNVAIYLFAFRRRPTGREVRSSTER